MAADVVTGTRSRSWTTPVVTGVLVLLFTLTDVTDSSEVLQPTAITIKHKNSDPSSNLLSGTDAVADKAAAAGAAHGKDNEAWRPLWLSTLPLKRSRRSSALAPEYPKLADRSSVWMIKPCMTWTLGLTPDASQAPKEARSSEPRGLATVESEKSVEKAVGRPAAVQAGPTCLEGPYLQAVVRKLDKAANLDYLRRAILERLRGSVPDSEPTDLPLPKTMWMRPAALAPCLNLTHTQLKVARLNAVRKNILEQIEGLSRLQLQGKAEGTSAKPKSKKKKPGKRYKRELWRRSWPRDVRGKNESRGQQERGQRPDGQEEQDEDDLQTPHQSATPNPTATEDPFIDHNTLDINNKTNTGTLVNTLDVHNNTNSSNVLDPLHDKIPVMETVQNMTSEGNNQHVHDTTSITDLYPEDNITRVEDAQNTTTVMDNFPDHNITAREENLLSQTNSQPKPAKSEAQGSGKELSPFLDKKNAVSFFPPRPAVSGRHWLRRVVEGEDESSSKDWDEAEKSDDKSKDNDNDDRHSEVDKFDTAMKRQDPQEGLSEEVSGNENVQKNAGRDLDEEDIAVPGRDSSDESEEGDSDERGRRELARHRQIASRRLWPRSKRVQRKDENDEKQNDVDSSDRDDKDDSESSDSHEADDEDDRRGRTPRLMGLNKESRGQRESLHGNHRQHRRRQGKDFGRKRRPPRLTGKGGRLSDPRKSKKSGRTATAVGRRDPRGRPECTWRRGITADLRPATNRRPDRRLAPHYPTRQEFGLTFRGKGNRPSTNSQRLTTQAPPIQPTSPAPTTLVFTQHETTTTPIDHDSSQRAHLSASSKAAKLSVVDDTGNLLRPNSTTSGNRPKNSSHQEEEDRTAEASSEKAPAETPTPGRDAVPLEGVLPPGSTLFLGALNGDKARVARVDVMMPADPQDRRNGGSVPETPVYVGVQYKPARAHKPRPQRPAG